MTQDSTEGQVINLAEKQTELVNIGNQEEEAQ